MKTLVSPLRLLLVLPPIIFLCPATVQAGDGNVSAGDGNRSTAEIAVAVAPAPAPKTDTTSAPAEAPARQPAPNPGATPSADMGTAGAPAEATASAPSDTRVAWQGDPIPMPLKVNVERRIDFPEPIAEMGVPRELEQHSRIVLTPTGRLHWTAKAPFAPTRVLATSVSGSLYQLDVSARTDGAAAGRLILTDPVLDAALAKANTPDEQARRELAAAQLIPDFLKQGVAGAKPTEKPSYVTLARFALAHFTGPRRLIPKLDAVRVAVQPIDTQAWLRMQSAALTLQPLAQWQAGDLYVTALGVFNRSEMDVAFDPRAFRGELRFAAALHPTLGPQGGGHHQSVWVVVTSQPFNRVLDHDPALTFTR